MVVPDPAVKSWESRAISAPQAQPPGIPFTSFAVDDVHVLASALNAGWQFAEDLNAEDVQHIGFTPSTIKDGVRQGTAKRVPVADPRPQEPHDRDRQHRRPAALRTDAGGWA